MPRTGKMLERVAKRLEARRGARIDLRVADSRQRGQTDLDLLIRYSPERGAPTRTEIAAFLADRFGGRIQMGEAADHGNVGQRHAAIHVEATLQRDSMQMSYVTASPADWKGMDGNVGSATSLMHIRTAEVWNVDRGPDGEPMLFRAEEDDLEDLLRQARSDRTKTAMPRVTFEHMNISAGVNCYDVGDTVRFYHNSTLCEGRINNMERDGRGGCHYFVTPNGESDPVKVPSGFMVSLVRKGAAARAETANRVQRHYRKVYPGTEFADRLTRG